MEQDAVDLAPFFMAIFAGLERAYGEYKPTSKTKQTDGGVKSGGKAVTQIGTVTKELWERHLAGKVGLGITPIRDDGTCSFGAIDIDQYEGMDLKKYEEDCERIGLPLVVCRTKSGGCHLYMFCSEPIPAALVRSKLTQFAAALGHVGVEIFPKQVELASKQDVGNWINMPYFAGDNTTRYAIKGGSALTPSQFLEYANRISVDQAALKAVEPVIKDDFMDGPPCLQILSRHGFPEGHRNDSLYSMGVYAKAKYGDEWEKVVDELNQKYMSPPLGSKEVQTLLKGLGKKDGYFYKCKQPPLCSHCNKEVCRQREHGIAANNENPGVQIDGLTKYMSSDKESNDKPIWIVSVEGRRIHLKDTKELMDQGKFTERCVEKLNKLLFRVKPHVWDAIIRDLLSRVEEIELPPDAGPEGRLWLMLEQFCTGRAQARSRDEIKLGKPLTENGRHFFQLEALMRYLDQQRFKEFTSTEVTVILKRRNGGHHAWHVKGTTANVWSIPAFAVQDEDFETPPMPEEPF